VVSHPCDRKNRKDGAPNTFGPEQPPTPLRQEASSAGRTAWPTRPAAAPNCRPPARMRRQLQNDGPDLRGDRACRFLAKERGREATRLRAKPAPRPATSASSKRKRITLRHGTRQPHWAEAAAKGMSLAGTTIQRITHSATGEPVLNVLIGEGGDSPCGDAFEFR
jgi:hypothetical protein